MCEILIENGADINFYEKSQDYDACLFVIGSQPDKVKIMVENGFNVIYSYKNGYRGFFLTNNLESLKILLENGLDANIRNKYNETPLMLNPYLSPDQVKLLIEYGADVNAYDIDERNNVLKNFYRTYKYNKEKDDTEESKERLEVIRILVENGARLYDNTNEDTIKEAKQISDVEDEFIELLIIAKYPNITKKLLTSVNLSMDEKEKIG